MTRTSKLLAVIPACGVSRRMGAPKPLLHWPASAQWWRNHALDRSMVLAWAQEHPEQTLLARTVAAYRAAGVEDLRVVVRLEDSPLLDVACALRLKPIAISNPPPDMLTSIAWGLLGAGIDRGETVDAFFVAPADQPPGPATLMPSLWTALKASDADAAAPVGGGRRGHPVLFRSALAWPILKAAAQRCTSFQESWHAYTKTTGSASREAASVLRFPAPPERIAAVQIPEDAGVDWLLRSGVCNVADVLVTDEAPFLDLNTPEDYFRAAADTPGLA